MRKVIVAGVSLGCLALMLTGCQFKNERWAKSMSGATTQFLCNILGSPNPPLDWEIESKKELKRRGLSCIDYPVTHIMDFPMTN